MKRFFISLLIGLFCLSPLFGANYSGGFSLGVTGIGGLLGISNGVCFNQRDYVGLEMETGSMDIVFLTTEWRAAYANYQHLFGKKEGRGFYLQSALGLARASYYSDFFNVIAEAVFNTEKEKVWETSFSAKMGCGYKLQLWKRCGLQFSFQNNLFFMDSGSLTYWVPSLQTTFFW